jgi:hypothetical protein
MSDDELEPIRPPSDATVLGRIIGRDRHLYAEAWGCDLSTEKGEKEFILETKFMSVDYAKACEGCAWGKEPDEEQFALNWRPQSMSEVIQWLADDERERRARIMHLSGPPSPPKPN